MDFTREPVVETIITPREGCKLVIRNSKGVGQEEYFVDSVEVISFGSALFYRSLERPKCFLMPVSDYEVLEVRETRVVLKHMSTEKGGIKIGGGRTARENKASRTADSSARKEKPSEKPPVQPPEKQEEEVPVEEGEDAPRLEKKRERRRSRRRRSRDDDDTSSVEEDSSESFVEEEDASPEPASEEKTPAKRKKRERAEKPVREEKKSKEEEVIPSIAALIPPPQTLISDNIDRYKELYSFEDKENVSVKNGNRQEKKEEEKEPELQQEVALPVEENSSPSPQVAEPRPSKRRSLRELLFGAVEEEEEEKPASQTSVERDDAQ